MTPDETNPADMLPEDQAAEHRAESIIRAAEYVQTAPAGEPINPDAVTADPPPEDIEELVERGLA